MLTRPTPDRNLDRISWLTRTVMHITPGRIEGIAMHDALPDLPLHERSAVDLAAAVARRELSAVEVVQAHLDRIDEVNPLVNAIVTLVPERALEEAKLADDAYVAGGAAGPLHGLPIAIKDLMDTAGIRTTYGSPIYADHVPTNDSLLVTRLRNAGAIVIGKTNTPEFGAGSHTFNPVFGATRNPWDLSKSAGGSSGGAGAALASGMLPIADGSDLGGSIRNPASFCNLVGLRPTPGRVASARPGNAWDPGSVLGPLGRSVSDVALLLSVLAGPESRAPLGIDESGDQFRALAPTSLAGVPVAFSWTGDGLPVEDSVLAVMAEFRERLLGMGAVVTDVEPDLAGADEVFETFRALEFFDGHGEDAIGHPDRVKATVRQEIDWIDALSARDVARAGALRTRVFRSMQSLFADYELMVMPTSQLPPFDIDIEYPATVAGVEMERYYTWQRSCSRITATAMPALSLPGGFTPEGLPVGVQLVAQYRADAALLSYGLAVEEATSDLYRRRPSIAIGSI
jgi:amidase